MVTMDIAQLLKLYNPLFTHNWTINRPQQMAMMDRWRERIATGDVPTFSEAGFRAFCQDNEDGMLLLLYTVLGMTNRKAVELCCGDGIECCSANLIVNHGWNALLVDGNADLLEHARSFYNGCRDTGLWPPQIVQAWIDADGVNALCDSHGYSGEIDLLTIDLDGNDYWIWKALTAVDPRVVIVEYQPLLGPEARLTSPYTPDFKAKWEDNYVIHGGASLAALIALGREKGYRLVACNHLGFNAVFVRNDLGADVFPEIGPEHGLTHDRAKMLMSRFGDAVKTFDWVAV